MKKASKYNRGFLMLFAALIPSVFLEHLLRKRKCEARRRSAAAAGQGREKQPVKDTLDIRFPRVLAAMLLGGALSVSGFLL